MIHTTTITEIEVGVSILGLDIHGTIHGIRQDIIILDGTTLGIDHTITTRGTMDHRGDGVAIGDIHTITTAIGDTRTIMVDITADTMEAITLDHQLIVIQEDPQDAIIAVEEVLRVDIILAEVLQVDTILVVARQADMIQVEDHLAVMTPAEAHQVDMTQVEEHQAEGLLLAVGGLMSLAEEVVRVAEVEIML